MKKLILGIFMALLFVTSVNAMTEDELYAKFEQTIEMNGTTYSVSSSDLNLVKQYLRQNEVSSEHCDYIAGKIDEAISIIKGQGTGEFKNFSQSAKNKLKNLVSDISTNTTVKATVTNGSLIVYQADGVTPFAEVDHLVKQTGVETNTALVVVLSFIIVSAGACLVVRQVKQN